jgi:hypothetical protein
VKVRLLCVPASATDLLSPSCTVAAPWWSVWSSPSDRRNRLGTQRKEETMTEDGTLSIVGQPYGYRVCYASNDAYGLERQPATGLDEAGLAACGVGPWAIQQAGAELQAGRMAILPLVCTRAQLDATFPHVPTSDVHVTPHPQRMRIRPALRRLWFSPDTR